jgi:hypothetical protein
MLAALVCLLAFSGQARATANINGSTSISYDPWTNLVTGVTTTELDYASQDWYQARVNGSITDANGSLLAGTFANDVDRDGTVSVTMQGSAVDQMEYTCTGTHIALADIQDYFQGHYYYVDNYNFGYYQSESTYRLFFYTFAGVGPMKRRSSRSLDLGKTFATVLAKPRIASAKPTFTPTSIAVNSQATQVDTAISASTVGLQSGDYAVVEIVQETLGATVTYAPPGQVIEVPLVLGGPANARFTITSVSAAGPFDFTVMISDIRRPNGQGGYQSILNQVTVNPGQTSTLTVHN